MATQSLGQRILVPFDGSALSAQAFALALGLARPNAALTVFHVDEGEDHGILGVIDSVTAAMQGEAAEGERIEAAIERGKAADGIIAAADRLDADLIVMSTRGRGGLARMALGSVTDQVVRSSHRSIAVIHGERSDHDTPVGEASQAPHRFGRVIVPLDGTQTSTAALPVGSDLAQRFGVPALLVSTIDLVPLTSPTMVQDIGMAMNMEDVYQQTRDSAEEWLSAASRQLTADGVANSTEFLTGSPAQAIEGLAHPDDLIVMATHGRTGLDRVLSGSVSDQLIRSGAAPVLIVRSGAPAGEE
jgi:nucleotide-binding universal stress UspA family protein